MVRDHSYITSALVGGEGGSENANFCLFLVLKHADVGGGEGVKKSQKCDDVIYEWSLNEIHIKIMPIYEIPMQHYLWIVCDAVLSSAELTYNTNSNSLRAPVASFERSFRYEIDEIGKDW